MAQLTALIKALPLRDGEWTHLRMKIFTFFTKVAAFVRFCSEIHQFGASLWMKKRTFFTFHAKFAGIVYIVTAYFCMRF